MPAPGALDPVKLGDGRPYLQFGGPRPNNRLYFYGSDTNYVAITGVSKPQLGGVDPIQIASPRRAGRYANIGKTISPADFPTGSLSIYEKTKSIPRHILGIDCNFNAYMLRGRCKSLADFDNGWEGYVEIYSNGLVTENNMGDRSSFDSDDPVMDELSVTFDDIYPVGGLSFTEKGIGATARLADLCYSDKTVCGECGPADDGTQKMYAVEIGQVAAKPVVWYSLNGGQTWASITLTAAANNEAPCAIRVMGGYLVVVSPTAGAASQGGYYFATLNPATGAPSSAFVRVLTGFSANTNLPRDMAVLSERLAYIVGDNGEIWQLTDVPSGATSLGIFTTEDFTRVATDGIDTIVAVATNGVVVRSINRGVSFGAPVTAPAGALVGVAVLDQNRWWAMTATGVFYTLDGGETAWVAAGLPITLAGGTDIMFASDEVGYIAYASGGVGRMLATINGGQSWTRGDQVNPRLVGLPPSGVTGYNRIRAPRVDNVGINANNLLIAGSTAQAYIARPNVF